jgi:hypothetical protein
MASDWIKMRVDLCEQVEVVQMTALLKVDAYAVIGRLHKLWAWVDKNSLDGQKMPITFSWIDEYVSCKNFATSLQKSGWLKGKDGAISFPNFDRHNGKTAKERAVSNRRVEKFRETDSKRNGNGVVTPPPLQKPLPEKNKRREETCISPEGNPSINLPKSLLPETGRLPFGIERLPEGVARYRVDRVREDDGEFDIECLDTGKRWMWIGDGYVTVAARKAQSA